MWIRFGRAALASCAPVLLFFATSLVTPSAAAQAVDECVDAQAPVHFNHYRDAVRSHTGRYLQPDPDGINAGFNRYPYGENQPLVKTDPDGRNPVALVRAFSAGYKAGEALNPVIQPTLTAAIDALLLPDPLDECLVLAENNKQIRKRIAGLQEQIDKHRKKLDKEPESQAANHWRNEIAAWQGEIERLSRRLPGAR